MVSALFEYYAQFQSITRVWSRALIKLGNPNLKNSVIKAWPLTQLDEALMIIAGYCVMVALGLMMKRRGSKQNKDDEKEPVLAWYTSSMKICLIGYNSIQVALCAYMTSAAIFEAYKKGYTLFCNDFDEKETGMASVLYVFYLSKILDFVDTFFIIVRKKWA